MEPGSYRNYLSPNQEEVGELRAGVKVFSPGQCEAAV